KVSPIVRAFQGVSQQMRERTGASQAFFRQSSLVASLRTTLERTICPQRASRTVGCESGRRYLAGAKLGGLQSKVLNDGRNDESATVSRSPRVGRRRTHGGRA